MVREGKVKEVEVIGGGVRKWEGCGGGRIEKEMVMEEGKEGL